MKDLQFLPEKVSSKVAKELFEKFQEYERIYQKVFAGMWSGVYCQVWCMQKILQLKILVLQIMWELQYQQSSGVLSTNFDEVVWRDGICVTGNSWLAVIWIMTRIQEFLTAFLLLRDKGKCKNLASISISTLRAKLSGTVYCNRSCLWLCVFVSVFVGLLPR